MCFNPFMPNNFQTCKMLFYFRDKLRIFIFQNPLLKYFAYSIFAFHLIIFYNILVCISTIYYILLDIW